MLLVSAFQCFALLAFENGIGIFNVYVVLFVLILLALLSVFLLTKNHYQQKEIKHKDNQIAQKDRKIAQLSQEITIRTENLENALQKAEEANHLKSLFLANMSHEIRTPLNSIMGFSELITEDDHDPSAKSLYAQQINQNSQQLLKTIDQIFHLSIIETGKARIRKKEFKVNEILDAIISDTRNKISSAKKNIRLIINLENPDYSITTDIEKFKLIIENLFDNSIKFTNQGIIEFTCYRMETEFLFRISDSGCGIREDECEIIFDPFKQGSEAMRKIKGGSGLGLSNVKNYVILLGGRIWCEMNRPSGTIFNFTLPATPMNSYELENLIKFSLNHN